MAVFPGFIGPSYFSRSTTVESEILRNLYPEQVESGLGKGNFCLYGRPGNSVFSAITLSPGQGILEIHGRCFAVTGGHVHEVFSDGTFHTIGVVGTLDPVSMAANDSQVIITSNAGGGWIVPLADTAGYAQIVAAGFPPNCDSVTYQDTYFIATQGGSQQIHISSPNDGTQWDPLDFASKEGYPDDVVSVQMVRRQLWILGTETSEVWWDSGQANFPFQPIQGALVQQGIAAVRSAAIVGNGLFWLGKSSRGTAVAFAEQNFAPIRVSNHAIENTWGSYANISDAVGYGYEENGHTFYVLSFPSANATWVLDTKTGFWHQWDWWNLTLGTSEAALARFHCYCFGKHLTLDWKIGNVFAQSLNTYTDNGGIIRRVRRAPHVDKLKNRIRHVRLQLDIETGSVPLTGPDSNPAYSLRYSDDGGFTFGNEIIRYIGKTGRYQNQTFWRQLGSSRDRVYEVTSTAGIAHAWAAAYLDTVDSTEAK